MGVTEVTRPSTGSTYLGLAVSIASGNLAQETLMCHLKCISEHHHLSEGQVSGGSHVQTEGPLGQFSTHIPGLARAMDRGLVLLLHLGGGDRNGFQSTGVPWGTGVPLPGGGDLTALTWHPPPFPSCWPSCPVCWEPHRYPQYFQDSVAISITDVTSTACGCTNPSLSSLSRKRKSPETSVT